MHMKLLKTVFFSIILTIPGLLFAKSWIKEIEKNSNVDVQYTAHNETILISGDGGKARGSDIPHDGDIPWKPDYAKITSADNKITKIYDEQYKWYVESPNGKKTCYRVDLKKTSADDDNQDAPDAQPIFKVVIDKNGVVTLTGIREEYITTLWNEEFPFQPYRGPMTITSTISKC